MPKVVARLPHSLRGEATAERRAGAVTHPNPIAPRRLKSEGSIREPKPFPTPQYWRSESCMKASIFDRVLARSIIGNQVITCIRSQRRSQPRLPVVVRLPEHSPSREG